MKKRNGLFAGLAGVLFAVVTLVGGLMGSTTHALETCVLDAQQYLNLAEKNLEIVRTFRTDPNTRDATRQQIDMMRNLVNDYCNVSDSRRITIRAQELPPAQARVVALGTEYLAAITKGDAPYAQRLMEAMLSLKDQIDREDAALIKREELTEAQVQRRTQQQIKDMRINDPKVQTAFAGTGICAPNNATFKKLAAIIERNLTSTGRVLALQASINSIQDQGPIRHALRIASTLAQMQANILLGLANPLASLDIHNQAYCNSIVSNDITISLNGTNYRTQNINGVYTTNNPMELDRRELYLVQAIVGELGARGQVFQNPIPVSVETSGWYTIGYNSANPGNFIVKEAQEPAPDPVPGCTDRNASNYNPDAKVDDGSCEYDILGCTDPAANNYASDATVDSGKCTYDILGCTDRNAENYNPDATKDDGSCIMPGEGDDKGDGKEPEGGDRTGDGGR